MCFEEWLPQSPEEGEWPVSVEIQFGEAKVYANPEKSRWGQYLGLTAGKTQGF